MAAPSGLPHFSSGRKFDLVVNGSTKIGRMLGPRQPSSYAIVSSSIDEFNGLRCFAQLMGEADLPFLGVALLGAVQIGDPDLGVIAGEHLGDDGAAAARATIRAR
jgi:hypothetical protein